MTLTKKQDLEFITLLTLAILSLDNHIDTRRESMSQETKKTGHSVALSGAIGFILVALLVGLIVGGYIGLFVLAPQVIAGHQNTNNQSNGENQATSTPYSNNNQATNNPNPNSNNPNTFYNSPTPNNPNGNNPNYNTNQTNTMNQTNTQNNSTGVTNNNPAPTNPTGQYSATGAQFSLNIPENGTSAVGNILANVNCVVQQNGNNIQLALTLTPTSIPQSLNQAVNNSPVTFNFAGTTSGSQITASASGLAGNDSMAPTFNLNLNGSFGSHSLTLTITPAQDSHLSVSTPQPLNLQSS